MQASEAAFIQPEDKIHFIRNMIHGVFNSTHSMFC